MGIPFADRFRHAFFLSATYALWGYPWSSGLNSTGDTSTYGPIDSDMTYTLSCQMTDGTQQTTTTTVHAGTPST